METAPSRSGGVPRGRHTDGLRRAGTRLGRLPGTTLFDQAVGVSGDGSVIAGMSAIGAQGEIAGFRWTAAGGLKPLPLPTGVSRGFASGVSADGSVVVGSFAGGEAGRWSGDGTFFSLGTLPGLGQYGSHATAVNADGSIVVGWANGHQRRQRMARAAVPVDGGGRNGRPSNAAA